MKKLRRGGGVVTKERRKTIRDKDLGAAKETGKVGQKRVERKEGKGATGEAKGGQGNEKN